MKKLIVLLSACLVASLTGYPQNIPPDEVPAPVKKAFALKFPSATSIKYEMEKKDYEVTFKDKGVGMSANFDATGKWLETETVIKESDLPKEVSASIARNFADFRISEITQVKTPNKGFIFEIVLKTDIEGYKVQISPKGNVLKTTPLKK